MFRNTILNIFSETWPMIVLCTIILTSMRIIWIIKNKKPFVFYKELIMLGFAIYIMCLFYVVTFQDVSWSTSNFVPFQEMFRYSFGSRLFFKNVIGNMIMFLPYGFFVGYFLRLNKGRIAFILSLITSITIEFIQLRIGRVFDVDDIILNLLGGMVGFYLYLLLFKLEGHLPNYLKKPLIYNIIIVLLLFLFIMYLMNIIELGV